MKNKFNDLKFTSVILLLIALSQTVFGQQVPIPIKYLESLPDYYQNYLKADVNKKYLANFAEDNAFSKFNYTFYNKIYYDQPLLVAYIRSILVKLEPNSTLANSLDIYITRSTEFNAFTIADGSIFVNIAALAEMSSEAELAYLMGHEYGHFKLEHVKKGYLQSRKNGVKVSSRKARHTSEFSQNNELDADSLGFVMANLGGYDSRAMDLLMQRLIFLQKQGVLITSKSYNEHDVLPTTHPVGEKRMDQIKLMKVLNDHGSLYPNGEERFNYIKKLAEFEYLKLLDESFDIHSMISFPLKKYLLTGDEVYLPTLVRGIRKALLLNPILKTEGFLTTHFANREERFSKKENILNHLYYEFPDSADVKLMQLKSVINLETIPFYSFEQAFKFFSEKAIAAGFQEPLLDKALYYGIKSAAGGNALDSYLKNPNNLYYDYANKLKSKKIIESLKGGDDVILLAGFHKHVLKRNWVYNNSVEEFKNRQVFLTEMRERYHDHELKYKIYNYEDFVQSNQFGVHLHTIEMLLYGGYSSKILEFDPRLYYAFKSANISSVEYLNMNTYQIPRRKFAFVLYSPPLTLYTLYYVVTHPLSFAENINYSECYRLLTNDKEWVGQINTNIQRWHMSRKRAERSLCRLDRNTRRGYETFLWIFKKVYK